MLLLFLFYAKLLEDSENENNGILFSYTKTAFIPSEAFAKGTPKPSSYNTGLIIGFIVAAAIGVIGLIIGIIGTMTCVRPIMQSSIARDKFDDDNLDDIYDD